MAHRLERINSLIRSELSSMLQRQVKDPRLGTFITVTEVSTSPDLRFARVYVTSMADEEERRQTLAGLAAAAGFFRSELAKRLSIRRVPEFTFEWDDSIERGARLLKLLDEVATDKKPS